MSPVNEEVQPAEDPRFERFRQRTTRAVGASERMPVRVLVLFVVAIACAAIAPIPANIVGVAAIVLLALDTAIHRR